MTDPPPHSDPARPSVELLLWAYRNGVFPMADPETGEIEWFTADPRAILPLEKFRVPQSLARVVRQGKFTITSDTAFERVMRACAHDRSKRNRSWISEEMVAAYTRLHEAGYAHSVEAWLPSRPGSKSRLGDRGAGGEGEESSAPRRQSPSPRQGESPSETCPVRLNSPGSRPEGEGSESRSRSASRILVGGLYGVHIGSAFFGESMFARPDLGGSNASKVCLVHLMNRLREAGFTLVDTQFHNPHLEQFGLIEIPLPEYLSRLKTAISKNCPWPL